MEITHKRLSLCVCVLSSVGTVFLVFMLRTYKKDCRHDKNSTVPNNSRAFENKPQHIQMRVNYMNSQFKKMQLCNNQSEEKKHTELLQFKNKTDALHILAAQMGCQQNMLGQQFQPYIF